MSVGQVGCLPDFLEVRPRLIALTNSVCRKTGFLTEGPETVPLQMLSGRQLQLQVRDLTEYSFRDGATILPRYMLSI